jgi:hypothetical protein
MDDKKEQLRRQVAAASVAHRSSPIAKFMSGRWIRRDGDVYGIVSQNDEQIKNADRPPRNIRPTR